MSGGSFKDLVGTLRQTLAGLPDRRTGANLSYAMEDFGLSAFANFFTQSPSFLAHQKAMQTARGANNAQSLFGIADIPCDNQVRVMLDPVPPQTLYPVYDRIYDTLRAHGTLQLFRGVHDSTLIALDGTWYHASQKIHCPCCSSLEHPNGQTQQDCEITAAKRWLEQNTARYLQGPVTLLGEDLYAHQPFCRRALLYGFHFIFTCKPDSPPTL